MQRSAAFALYAFCLGSFFVITAGAAFAQPFAYIANGNNSISGYTIDPASGALTQLPGSPFAGGSDPFAIQFTPDAKFAYIANYLGNAVSGYSLNGTNGELTPIAGSPFPTEDGAPVTLAIAPSGKFLYTVNLNNNLDLNGISGFSINGETGELTQVPGSPLIPFLGFFGASFAFTPSGAFLYASNSFGLNSSIAGFAVNADGSLTQVAGSPFSSSYPDGLAVAPSGNYLFVGDQAGFIEVYGINASTGALALVSSVPTLDTFPVTEVTTSAGEFLYGGVVQAMTPNGFINGFQIDTATGGLSPVSGSPYTTGLYPQSLAGSRSGRFLYVADEMSSEVSGYSIDAATGALMPIAGSPFPVSYPVSIALADPAAKECGAINVSREVTLTPGPYTRQPVKSDLFDETLAITNGITAVPGPLSVVLLGLPSSTTSLSGTYKGLSTTYCFSASGNYVVPINSLLPAGNHGVLLPDEVVDVPFVFRATQDGHAVKPTGYVPKLVRGTLDK